VSVVGVGVGDGEPEGLGVEVGLAVTVAVTVAVAVAVTVVAGGFGTEQLIENFCAVVVVVMAPPVHEAFVVAAWTAIGMPTMAATATRAKRACLNFMGSPAGWIPVVKSGQAASGVNDQPCAVKVKVLPDAHACDDDSAAEPRKLPADDASQNEMCVRVSEVPPLVHDGAVPFIAIAPPDAAAHVIATRVVEPAAAAVAPDAPGSPVWSLTNGVAMPVNVVPRRTLSQALARLTVLTPTVILRPSGRSPHRRSGWGGSRGRRW
jgi:hypothetical protein